MFSTIIKQTKTRIKRRRKTKQRIHRKIKMQHIFVVSPNRQRTVEHTFPYDFSLSLHLLLSTFISNVARSLYTRIYYYYYVLYCFIINLWHRSLATLSSAHFCFNFFSISGFWNGSGRRHWSNSAHTHTDMNKVSLKTIYTQRRPQRPRIGLVRSLVCINVLNISRSSFTNSIPIVHFHTFHLRTLWRL